MFILMNIDRYVIDDTVIFADIRFQNDGLENPISPCGSKAKSFT